MTVALQVGAVQNNGTMIMCRSFKSQSFFFHILLKHSSNSKCKKTFHTPIIITIVIICVIMYSVQLYFFPLCSDQNINCSQCYPLLQTPSLRLLITPLYVMTLLEPLRNIHTHVYVYILSRSLVIGRKPLFGQRTLLILGASPQCCITQT